VGPIVRVQFHALRERLVFVDTAQIGLGVLSLCGQNLEHDHRLIIIHSSAQEARELGRGKLHIYF
jgi:hypothetical protein